MAMVQMLMLAVIWQQAYAGGHTNSFAYFKGPVVAPAHEVVHGAQGGGYGAHGYGKDHGGNYVDYVAYPHYEFGYGVTDRHTGDSHGQKESRDGHHVVGEYTLKEPGGNVRTVKYHADNKGGFQAEVINSGGNDHSGGTYGGYEGGHGSYSNSYASFDGPVAGPSYEAHGPDEYSGTYAAHGNY